MSLVYEVLGNKNLLEMALNGYRQALDDEYRTQCGYIVSVLDRINKDVDEILTSLLIGMLDATERALFRDLKEEVLIRRNALWDLMRLAQFHEWARLDMDEQITIGKNKLVDWDSKYKLQMFVLANKIHILLAPEKSLEKIKSIVGFDNPISNTLQNQGGHCLNCKVQHWMATTSSSKASNVDNLGEPPNQNESEERNSTLSLNPSISSGSSSEFNSPNDDGILRENEPNTIEIYDLQNASSNPQGDRSSTSSRRSHE